MRNSNVTILTVFMVIAAVLLAATIFHWKHTVKKQEININRAKTVKRIQKEFTTMNFSNRRGRRIILDSLFKQKRYLTFLAIYNDRHQPIFMRSRMRRDITQQAINLIKKPEIRRLDITKFSGNNIEGFSFMAKLHNNENGRVILLFDQAIFNVQHAITLRQFIIFSLIIILIGIMVPFIMNHLSFRYPKKESEITIYSPADDKEDNKELALLQQRNSILEKEIEQLADFRDINFTAAAKRDCASLIEYIQQTVQTQLGAKKSTIYIEKNHAVHAMQNHPELVKIISKKQLNRMHKIVMNSSFSGKDKVLLPLTANENRYGMIKLSQPTGNETFSDGTVQKFSQLINQVSLHLYNFILYDIALTDALTGLYTRRHFDERCSEEIYRTMRYKIPFSLVMMDLDHFKQINDTYGHQSGDTVLKETAKIIKESIRRTDHAFRFGGEEFAIILPETSLEIAAELMEKIRKTIALHPFQTKQGNNILATASFGITTYYGNSDNAGSKTISPPELMEQADKALYCSKKNGRNMVSRHSSVDLLKKRVAVS